MKLIIYPLVIILLLSTGLSPSISAQAGQYRSLSLAGPPGYLEQKVFNPAGEANAWFGYSVAISGDTALIGVPHETVGTNAAQGAAYVYIRQGRAWSLQARLFAAGGEANDNFGFSVAIDGDTALIGVIADTVNANALQGSAIIFTRSGSVWTEGQMLVAADGAPQDSFGAAVALDGVTAVVGAIGSNGLRGAAYFYTDSGAEWLEDGKVTDPDGLPGDRLGWSVALSGDIALIGAPDADLSGFTDRGLVVVARNQSGWVYDTQLASAIGKSEDYYGTSVAISGNVAAIGVPGDDVGTNFQQGSVDLWQIQDSGAWVYVQTITASDGNSSDVFGTSLAMDGNRLVVGAPWHTVGSINFLGAAYIFTPSPVVVWEERGELSSSDGAQEDYFAGSVSISGASLVAGAYRADIGLNTDQGAAYFFTVPALYMPLVTRALP